jgi:hypothetical protein
MEFCPYLSVSREWTRGDSNPWPPPCEGGLGSPPSFWRVEKAGLLKHISAFSTLLFSCSVLVRLQYGCSNSLSSDAEALGIDAPYHYMTS